MAMQRETVETDRELQLQQVVERLQKEVAKLKEHFAEEMWVVELEDKALGRRISHVLTEEETEPLLKAWRKTVDTAREIQKREQRIDLLRAIKEAEGRRR